jgi:hypothetical protein
MTAHELLEHLQGAGIELSLAPEGMLRCRAPQGVLTPPLADAVRLVKAELVALLTEPPPPVPAPARSYRQWVTGHIPQTATIPLAEPLPEPAYHDKPSPCRTYVGRPCAKKVCKGNRSRFWPSQTCTVCWQRAQKVTNVREIPSEETAA